MEFFLPTCAHEIDPWSHPQTLDSAGKAFQGQTLKLITKTRKLQTKKSFITLAPGSSRVTGYVLQILLNEKLQKNLMAQQSLDPGKKNKNKFHIPGIFSIF